MIRRSLAVVALLAAACVAQAADVPLAARITIYRRPLPYVNGVLAVPAVPSVKLNAPASGWGNSIEEIRNTVAARRKTSGAAVAELFNTTISSDGTDVFASAAGGSIKLQRTESGVAVTLPQAKKSLTIPAKRGTTVFAGADEMLYAAITLVPPAELDPPTVVIAGLRPPELLHRVDPPTPVAAKEEHVGGIVLLQARIETDGSVSSAAVITSPRDDFATAAAQALRQWKFAPNTKVNGQPAVAYLNVTMSFAAE